MMLARKHHFAGLALAVAAFLSVLSLSAHATAPARVEIAQIELAQAEQSIADAVEALQDKAKRELEAAALALKDLKVKVEAAEQVDVDLAELKIDADNIGAAIATTKEELSARLALIAKRVEELGAAPADGKTEDASIAADRGRLGEEKAQISTIVADADALALQAKDLSDHITDIRRNLFAATVFRYTEINGELFDNAGDAAARTSRSLVNISSSSIEFMWRFKSEGLLIALGATLLLGVVIWMMVRRFFRHLIHRDPNDVAPGYMHRLSLAFWSATIPAFALALVTTCGLGFLFSFNVLREEVFNILRAMAWASVGVYYVWKLARGLVSPDKPQWRLLEVSDIGARRLVAFAVALAVINGLSYVLAVINVELDAPLVLTVVEGFFASVATGITLIMLSFLKPLDGALKVGSAWARFSRVLVLLTGIALIVSALVGYVGLSRFVSSQIVVTGAILVTMYVGFLSAHTMSQHNVFGQTALGQTFSRRGGFGEVRLDQLGLVVGLLVHLVVLLIGIPMIMLTWGFTGADISTLFVRIFTEIRIGNINISLIGILVGIGLFFIGLFATRWFQRWLDGNVMARSHVDTGVRNSVNTVLGYAGIVVAALIGVSAAGFNLSSLALIAGALSLGVGFGLQTIVQNFVSGLILLVERPFKVGDWIVNGPVEGFVRRISVRATEIETFQNQSIIVPNSQLINASVGNWTLRNTLARSEILVSTTRAADPKQVIDLLTQIAHGHPLVLTMPEPGVSFRGFGESSFDFELLFHVADIFQGGPVRNDIRLEIVKRFREEGIEMPTLRRDIHVTVSGLTGPLEKALAAEGLSRDVIERIVERTEQGETPASRPRRGRPVDLADDDDGSPFDGMHHATRDNDDADGNDGDGDGVDDGNHQR